MRATVPTPAEFRALVRLAVPVVVVQVGLMLMGVVDTLMVGHLSARALGAVALGNLYFFTIAIVGVGTLMALDPLISQAVGAGDEPAIARALQRGLVLACLGTVPVCLGLALVRPVLAAAGEPAELLDPAAAYIRVIIPGMLPFFVFVVFRQTLQAVRRIAPIVAVTLTANLLNAGLNWVFIFGHLGSPALGVAGSALATTVSRWVMAAALLAAGWKELGPRLLPWWRDAFDVAALGRMLRIGLPIGGQMFLEYGIFALVGALMGRISTLAVGGHQIALNLAALVFMVPQGTGAATAVLVGQAIGAEDGARASRAAAGGLLLGGGFMVASATVFLAAAGILARLYTPDPAVQAVARPLIQLAGAFAVFDGLQAVTIGILRGIGDTRAPVVISMLGYWLIGLPASLLLGFRLGMGPPGLWWGLVLGLAVTAVVLLARVRLRLQGRIHRLLVDHPVALAGGP
jgi:MATE family multidrug resistance protein